ncbi:MAG: bifunctional DNA-formamidopyrimidine glycosylase/DNA-(apurinic or apyrimidinic site) lyase [Aeromonas sp.]
MPELPEVEVSGQGIAPYLTTSRVQAVVVRNARLRWPIPAEIQQLVGQHITRVWRRAKYLLLECANGTAILHLGMSGSLRVLPADTPAGKHDHVDIVLASGKLLRLNDPRRFGALLWTTAAPLTHPLLAKLGPEPLSDDFQAAYLFAHSRGRRCAIKPYVMDNHVVVGVGNIYASEALFNAGIDPRRAAGSVTQAQCARLVAEIKTVLAAAIRQGGTTLRDFSRVDGKPGYFVQQLQVYGRGGQPCPQCQTTLSEVRLGQRSSVFCPHCQQ